MTYLVFFHDVVLSCPSYWNDRCPILLHVDIVYNYIYSLTCNKAPLLYTTLATS